MKTSFIMLALLTVLCAGCVVGGGYYDGGYYDGGYAPYGDYYDEVFIGGDGEHHHRHEDRDYRGWGPGYHVGPYRHGEREGFGGGGGGRGRGEPGGAPRGGGHAFRSPPVSHPMPSLPSRGGGSRR